MNYELAKKLYDAGFPGIRTWTTHNYVGDFQTQIDCTQCGDSVKLQGGTLITGYNMDCPKGEAKYSIPTLSELIKACGDRFNSLSKQSKWTSEDMEWIACEGSGNSKSGIGSTPEEAVAYLYLELNKKDI